MTLEASRPGAAAQNECGQHGQGCKNPTHLSLPSRGFHACSSGGLAGDLRAYLGRYPSETGKTVRNLAEIQISARGAARVKPAQAV